MSDQNHGIDLEARWYDCLGCDARYRSQKAARLCCDRQAQKAAIGRLRAAKQ